MNSLVRIALKFVANAALVWWLATQFGEFFILQGDVTAVLIVGALVTAMNILVRPLLALITLPLKLFATLLAIIVVNGAFVQLIVIVVQNLRSDLVSLQIGGGLLGWVIVAVVLGIGNWLTKVLMK